MPDNPFPVGLTYITDPIYGNMPEVSDNSVPNIYIPFNWPHAD